MWATEAPLGILGLEGLSVPQQSQEPGQTSAMGPPGGGPGRVPPGGNGGFGVPRGDPREGQDVRIVPPKFLPWDLREGWEGWGLPWALAGARSRGLGQRVPRSQRLSQGCAPGPPQREMGMLGTCLGATWRGQEKSLTSGALQGRCFCYSTEPEQGAGPCRPPAGPSSARLGTKTRMLRGSGQRVPPRRTRPQQLPRGRPRPSPRRAEGRGLAEGQKSRPSPPGRLRHTWTASA